MPRLHRIIRDAQCITGGRSLYTASERASILKVNRSITNASGLSYQITRFASTVKDPRPSLSRPTLSTQDEQASENPSKIRRALYILAWIPVVLSFTHLGGVATVTGGSMAPTLNPTGQGRDVVLLNRYIVKANMLQIGDVVTLISPNDPNSHLTKRILAMSGDIVTINSTSSGTSSAKMRIRIPPNHVWLEGDASVLDKRMDQNYSSRAIRPKSRDSREFGPVPLGLITARVEMVLWPPSRCGPLPLRSDFDAELKAKLRQIRAQRQSANQISKVTKAHPEDSSITPYRDWEWASDRLRGDGDAVMRSSIPRQGSRSEDEEQIISPMKKSQRSSTMQSRHDDDFELVWRERLNSMSRGGQLGDNAQRAPSV